jgi:cytochrome c oxidase subunit 3
MGLIFAIWYWHFVDIIWIIVFLTVYFWGNW